MSLKSAKICTKTWHLVFFVFLACSRDFLSMIFGIFGKFRIDIVKNKFETIFFQNEKKSEQKTKTIFFEKMFSSRKKFSEIFWTPMSIQNFPKIPKIILRKSADEPKDAKTDLRHFFSQIWTRPCWLNIILWFLLTSREINSWCCQYVWNITKICTFD